MADISEGAARIRRLRFEKEFLVGLLVFVAIILMFIFGWLMGVFGTLGADMRFHVLYDFAGGVELGSPVRVSGVKVGRVDKIRFLPRNKSGEKTDVTLQITVTVSAKASAAVREDSEFYINMAGVIGERYVEISPGSMASLPLKSGAVIRGIDPPRIDQLLSQGYGVFGKVQEFLDDNRKNLSEFSEQLAKFIGETNKWMGKNEGKKLFTLLENLVEITSDLKSVTRDLSDPKSRKFFDQIAELIDRAHKIDQPVLRKFLQEEGIRARIF